MAEQQTGKQHVSIWVPRDLWAQMRRAAFEQSKPVSALAEEAMTSWLAPKATTVRKEVVPVFSARGREVTEADVHESGRRYEREEHIP